MPDIIWYHNNKIIRNKKNVKIRIKDNKTTCTIHKATPKDEGTYICKATSAIGVKTTKAHLQVQPLAPEEKKELELQKAREDEEKIKPEKVKLDKKPKDVEKVKGVVKTEEDEKASADIQEVQVLESAKPFEETTTKEKATPIISPQEPVTVSCVATRKHMGETTTDITRPEEKAKPVAPVQESVTVSDVQMVDVVEPFTEEVTKQKAKPVVSTQDSVSVTEVTVEDTTTTFKRGTKTRKAVKTTSTQESVVVSEVTPETVAKEFEDTVDSKTAERIVSTQESITISEVQPEATVEEVEEKKPRTRKARVEKKPALKETATVTEVKPKLAKETEEVVTKVEEILEKEKKKVATEVTRLMDLVRAEEFGPGESPLRELATVGFLVRRGVTVSEIVTLYEADRFPALRAPEAQSAMVRVVEREGLTSLITQVLAEETTADEVAVAATVGFRAFMRMVELRHAAVEEVITHFAPEDFQPHVWETADVSEIVTEGITETVESIQQTEVHMQALLFPVMSGDVSASLVACCMVLYLTSFRVFPPRVQLPPSVQSALLFVACAVLFVKLALWLVLN